MKKASWIVLTVGASLVTLGSLVSAGRAYNTGDDFNIGPSSVSEVAAGKPAVATALRGIRGTSAAYAAAYGALLLCVILGPYRRGEVWAWWAILTAGLVVAVVALLRIPFLGTSFGAVPAVIQAVVLVVGLLLDVGRLKGAR